MTGGRECGGRAVLGAWRRWRGAVLALLVVNIAVVCYITIRIFYPSVLATGIVFSLKNQQQRK